MTNMSDKSDSENQDKHLMFKNCFPKIVTNMKQCGKTW